MTILFDVLVYTLGIASYYYLWKTIRTGRRLHHYKRGYAQKTHRESRVRLRNILLILVLLIEGELLISWLLGLPHARHWTALTWIHWSFVAAFVFSAMFIWRYARGDLRPEVHKTTVYVGLVPAYHGMFITGIFLQHQL